MITRIDAFSPRAHVHADFELRPRCRATSSTLLKNGASVLALKLAIMKCTKPFRCAPQLPVRRSNGTVAPQREAVPSAHQMKNGETVAAYPPENRESGEDKRKAYLESSLVRRWLVSRPRCVPRSRSLRVRLSQLRVFHSALSPFCAPPIGPVRGTVWCARSARGRKAFFLADPAAQPQPRRRPDPRDCHLFDFFRSPNWTRAVASADL